MRKIDFTGAVTGGPNDHGFDYYFGDDVPNWPPYVWHENERLLGKITAQMKAGVMVGVSAGPAVNDWDFRAVLAEYSKRCSHYLRERAEQKRPFFLYVPLPSPHTPIAPHEDFRGTSKISEYADFLIQTDTTIGTLMSELKDSEQADNTVVIFTCDNGTSPKADFPRLDAAGVRLNEHWRGWKADAYEGGHRVPFAVRWPGRIEPGSQCEQTITLADVMATCADVLGHDLPAEAAEDSVSLLPTLQGQQTSEPLHDVVVHHSVSGHFAVRSGKWKLLFCRGSGGWSPPREAEAEKQNLPPVQLYNLHDDPKETVNLQADHPEVVKQLTAELRRVIEQGRSTPGPGQPQSCECPLVAGVAVAAAVTSVADFQGAKPEIRQRPAASFVLRGTRGTPQVTAPRDCATGWQNVEFSAELKYTMWRSRLDVLLAAGMETRPNAELFSEEPIQALFRGACAGWQPALRVDDGSLGD